MRRPSIWNQTKRPEKRQAGSLSLLNACLLAHTSILCIYIYVCAFYHDRSINRVCLRMGGYILKEQAMCSQPTCTARITGGFICIEKEGRGDVSFEWRQGGHMGSNELRGNRWMAGSADSPEHPEEPLTSEPLPCQTGRYQQLCTRLSERRP